LIRAIAKQSVHVAKPLFLWTDIQKVWMYLM